MRTEDPLAFVYGGVAFQVHPEPNLRFRLADAERADRDAFHVASVAAHVDCVVAAAPELEDSGALRCEWRGDEGRFEAAGVRGEVRRLSAGRYASTVLVSPGERGCSALVTALAGLLRARESAAEHAAADTTH